MSEPKPSYSLDAVLTKELDGLTKMKFDKAERPVIIITAGRHDSLVTARLIDQLQTMEAQVITVDDRPGLDQGAVSRNIDIAAKAFWENTGSFLSAKHLSGQPQKEMKKKKGRNKSSFPGSKHY